MQKERVLCAHLLSFGLAIAEEGQRACLLLPDAGWLWANVAQVCGALPCQPCQLSCMTCQLCCCCATHAAGSRSQHGWLLQGVQTRSIWQHGMIWLSNKAVLFVWLQDKHFAQEVVHDLQAAAHSSADAAVELQTGCHIIRQITGQTHFLL